MKRNNLLLLLSLSAVLAFGGCGDKKDGPQRPDDVIQPVDSTDVTTPEPTPG